jgi:hypothetical protein
LIICWASGAAQEAVLPPSDPTQLHCHGPLPATVEAVPAEQRLVVGVVLTATPFAAPHEPLTTCCASGAAHEAVAPPFVPLQLQVHGPVPLTPEAPPAEHKLVVGAMLTGTPFAVPHEPLVSSCAEQLAVAPPPDPAQVQSHGPAPVTVDAVPALQRFVVGALVRSAPFEEPHAPLTPTKEDEDVNVA